MLRSACYLFTVADNCDWYITLKIKTFLLMTRKNQKFAETIEDQTVPNIHCWLSIFTLEMLGFWFGNTVNHILLCYNLDNFQGSQRKLVDCSTCVYQLLMSSTAF